MSKTAREILEKVYRHPLGELIHESTIEQALSELRDMVDGLKEDMVSENEVNRPYILGYNHALDKVKEKFK